MQANVVKQTSLSIYIWVKAMRGLRGTACMSGGLEGAEREFSCTPSSSAAESWGFYRCEKGDGHPTPIGSHYG